MAKMRLWSSAPGIIALVFFLAAIAGAVLEFVNFYLPEVYATYQADTTQFIWLIGFILNIAVAGFALIAIIISIFGAPKALWIIFAFLSLACALVFPLIIFISGATTSFLYIEGAWFQSHMMDFIGFWLAAGGSFLAMIVGFFVPKEY
ncbi:MAG: hypothetical protein ACTSQF_13320 [Candidatus Heimdallarchaeaceae archaeon]